MISLRKNPIDRWNPIITTDSRLIIALAWGKRRVSSRSPEGTMPYPASVGAALGLWLRWVWHRQVQDRRVYVVVGHHKAQARIDAAVADLDNPAAPSMSQEEVALLLHERAMLRSAGEYEAADAIRDRLVAAGVQIADQKVTK